MVKLFTSRLSYEGPDKINATVKSGSGLGDCLAPTWALLAGHKLHVATESQNQEEIQRWGTNKFSGEPTTPLSNEAYTEQYLDLLRQRYTENKQPFLDILNQERSTITCYCGSGQFCHRHLAVDVLEKIALKHAIPFEHGGELDPRTGRRWLAPDDPDRRDLQFGVVPVFTPQGAPRLGYAVVGRISNPKNINVAIELGHFRSYDSAEKYLDDLSDTLNEKALPLSGTKVDIQTTEHFLSLRACEHGLPGIATFLTHARNKAWDDYEFGLTHTPEEMRFPSEQQDIRFGVLPIKAPNGLSSLGLAATALVQQGDTHALLELAHFANNGEERAHQYLDEVEDTLEKGGFPVAGLSQDIQRTVDWLTGQARGNDLPGDWQPLTSQQAKNLEAGELSLTHSFREVRTMSGGGIRMDR